MIIDNVPLELFKYKHFLECILHLRKVEVIHTTTLDLKGNQRLSSCLYHTLTPPTGSCNFLFFINLIHHPGVYLSISLWYVSIAFTLSEAFMTYKSLIHPKCNLSEERERES